MREFGPESHTQKQRWKIFEYFQSLGGRYLHIYISSDRLRLLLITCCLLIGKATVNFLQSKVFGLIFDHLIQLSSAGGISQDKRKKFNFVFHIIIQLLALQLSRVKLLGGNVTLCKTVQTGVMSKAVATMERGLCVTLRMKECVDGLTRRPVHNTNGRDIREGKRCPTVDRPPITPPAQP